MNVLLGHNLDHGAYHPLTGSQASAGDTTCGPAGITGILETFLGLPSQHKPEILRVLQYESILRKIEKKNSFFSESFAIDPRGAASKFLSLRDEILLNAPLDFALSDLAETSERIRILPAAEAHATSLNAGYPDRLRGILKELKRKRITVPLSKVTLTEPADTWPSLWRAIFKEIKSQGCIFDQYERAVSESKGDLSAAKRTLAHQGKAADAQADGSLLLFEANNPVEEADVVALMARELSKGGESVAVIAGQETNLLNDAFMRINEPLPGGTLSSHGLDVLQILPLCFALSWSSADPRVLQQYLSLSVSPLPHKLRRQLLGIVSRTGSIGGSKWNEIIASYVDSIEKEKRDEVKTAIECWLGIGRIGPDDKMTTKDIDALCKTFEAWARKRAFLNETPELSMTMAIEQAKAISDACMILDTTAIERQELKALMRDIVATMPTEMRAIRERGSVYSVASPGAILGPIDNVIWWNAGERSLEPLPSRFWTGAEENELRQQGIVLPEAVASLARQRCEWNRGISLARKRLLFAYSRTHGDERQPDEIHPVWHELTARFGKESVGNLVVTATDMLHGKPIPFVEKHVKSHLRTEELRSLPAYRPEWNLKPSLLKDRDHHSASSITTLGGCPFAYVCGYLAKIESAETFTVSEQALLYGNVAHDVIERFLESCDGWPDKRSIGKTVRTIFQQYLEKEGAVLNLPGMDAERIYLEKRIILSCEQLVAIFAAGHYDLLGIEKEYAAKTEIGPMKGLCDLVLKKSGSSKGRAVIDLKWGGRSRKYQELADGTSIQLAVYSELLGSPYPPTGYFIISSGELLTVHGDEFPGATIVDGPDERDVWKKVVEVVGLKRKALSSGKAVLGTPEEKKVAPDFIYAPCRYCELDLFCRTSESL
jgi:hypothetical protein